jgi:hypothetical protein
VPTPSPPPPRFAPRSLALAVALTALAAVVTVIVVRAITLSVVTVPSAFTPLAKASSAIFLSVIGVLAAAAACLLLNRVADRPVAAFRRVAPIALVVSFAPDIAIWASHAYHHTAKASTVLPLMIMHLLVAGLCVAVLPRFGAISPAARVVAASG